MSTKIYNGLRLRNCTLEQALAKLRSIRPACVEAGAKAIASGIATRMAFAADLAENYCPLKPASGSSRTRAFSRRGGVRRPQPLRPRARLAIPPARYSFPD